MSQLVSVLLAEGVSPTSLPAFLWKLRREFRLQCGTIYNAHFWSDFSLCQTKMNSNFSVNPEMYQQNHAYAHDHLRHLETFLIGSSDSPWGEGGGGLMYAPKFCACLNKAAMAVICINSWEGLYFPGGGISFTKTAYRIQAHAREQNIPYVRPKWSKSIPHTYLYHLCLLFNMNFRIISNWFDLYFPLLESYEIIL